MSRPPDRSWMLATLMASACANASRTTHGARDTAPSVAPAVLRNVRRSARMNASGKWLKTSSRALRGPESSPPRFGVSRRPTPAQTLNIADLLACLPRRVYSARAMDLAAVLALEILNGIASLVLISVGLAIVFGMMRVINLAHGEFLMLGGYAAIVATNRGVNIWIAMLVVAPIVVGIIGVIAERLIIRVLYGRMIDTLLATWGLSLFFVGLVTTIFGNTVAGIGAPLGSVAVGRYSISLYRLVLIGVAAAILVAIYVVLRTTRLGLVARGTMENPGMAAALGVSPPRVYAATFGVGAALTGLAGGLLAPISGVLPTVGAAYVAKAFITVISGGTAIMAGTASAASLFGSVNLLLTYLTTPVIGEAGLLAAAILLLRVLPHGITGKLFRGSL